MEDARLERNVFGLTPLSKSNSASVLVIHTEHGDVYFYQAFQVVRARGKKINTDRSRTLPLSQTGILIVDQPAAHLQLQR